MGDSFPCPFSSNPGPTCERGAWFLGTAIGQSRSLTKSFPFIWSRVSGNPALSPSPNGTRGALVRRPDSKNSINDPQQCLVESRGNAIAGGTGCAYRSCFNDHCAETLVCPQQTSLVGDRRAFAPGYFRPPRPRRRIRRAQPSGRKEARVAARPHPDQSLFRGIDPYPGLV